MADPPSGLGCGGLARAQQQGDFVCVLLPPCNGSWRKNSKETLVTEFVKIAFSCDAAALNTVCTEADPSGITAAIHYGGSAIWVWERWSWSDWRGLLCLRSIAARSVL